MDIHEVEESLFAVSDAKVWMLYLLEVLRNERWEFYSDLLILGYL